MVDQEQYKNRCEAVNELIKGGLLSIKELSNILDLGDLLQQWPTSTSEIPALTSLLQASNCSHSNWGINVDKCLDCGITGLDMAMSGFDPNDIQCCNPASGAVKIYIDGKPHTMSCPVTKKWETQQADKYAWPPRKYVPEKYGCEHDFTTYEGLLEKFDYCRKCDVKRS